MSLIKIYNHPRRYLLALNMVRVFDPPLDCLDEGFQLLESLRGIGIGMMSIFFRRIRLQQRLLGVRVGKLAGGQSLASVVLKKESHRPFALSSLRIEFMTQEPIVRFQLGTPLLGEVFTESELFFFKPLVDRLLSLSKEHQEEREISVPNV